MSVTRLPTTIEACRNLLRYSRESNERLLGIYGQDAAIEEWAENEGYEIVGSERDISVHSQSAVDTREGLVAIIRTIEAGGADGVVVHRLDRLARNWEIQDDAVQRIWGAGGRLFSTDYGEWKPDRPGQPQWHLRKKYAEIAEAEYYALLARLQEGRRRKMAHGGYGGGNRYARRYGVELVRIQGVLEYRPIPAEQDVIRRMCASHAEGVSYREIARQLNAEGVPTVTGVAWSHKVVGKLVVRGPDRIAAIPEDLPVVQPLAWAQEARA